jgi:hypothetical protein
MILFLPPRKYSVSHPLISSLNLLFLYPSHLSLSLSLFVFKGLIIVLYYFVKSCEVRVEWRKLHSEELHIVYSSPNIIRQIKSRRMRWAGHVSRIGEEGKFYRVLVGKPDGKRPLGRPRRR